MKICLIGGIFGKSEEYREAVAQTPETLLSENLRARGHTVCEQAHSPPFALEGFDVVHVHHLGLGAIAAASASMPLRLAFTPHSFRQPAWSRRAAERYVIGRADALVALSETEARQQRERFSCVLPRQHVIPNGIDDYVFRFEQPRPPVRGEPWRLLYVGQLAPLKGVHFLFQALAKLPKEASVELSLVYHVDIQEAELRREADLLKLRGVRFVGPRTPAELARLYADSHLLVLPSMGEALPSVITEAVLVGRPVVATDVGAIREQVGGFGVLVPPRDPGALAAAIVRTFASYDRYVATARETSRLAAQRYSTLAMAAGHERMYLRLVERPPSPRALRQRILDRPLRIMLRID